MNAEYQDATFYAQVEPEWYPRYAGGEPNLKGAKVVTITQKRPTRPRGGTVLLKLTVRVPSAAFLPLRPEAVIVIPESMTETTPITVEAADPAGVS